jgi:type IV secretory pathway VirJ component
MKWIKRASVVSAIFALFLTYIGYFSPFDFEYIPATETPAPGKADIAAVVVSGDMGLNIGMGGQIAERLAAAGIPVIGVNSLTFFRNKRSPNDVVTLINDATKAALKFGKAKQVILIGQSFGADMLPVGLVGMPAELRAKVRMVGLVVPTDTLYFRASPSEMFNWSKPDGDALPYSRKLTWVPTICIYGAEERASLCPALKQPNVHSVTLPGGHPLHRDADAVLNELSAAIDDIAPSASHITKMSGDAHAADTTAQLNSKP